MNKKQAWWIFGAGVVYYYFLRGVRSLQFGIKRFALVSFSDKIAEFEVVFFAYNPLLISLFLRGVKGTIRLMGIEVGIVNYPVNQDVKARSYTYIPVRFTVEYNKIGEGLVEYLKTGNVNTLLIEFEGTISLGRDHIVDVPIKKQITWGDIAGG